jgi:tetratricopeptide (TPR) repeat protein
LDLLEAGRFEEALHHLRASIHRPIRARHGRTGRSSATAARLYFNMGYALSRLGRHFAAARAYRRCVELTPDDADTWFNLGNAYREAGALRRAGVAYSAAARLAPDDHEVWNNLGNVRAAVGDACGAEVVYRRSVALRPDYHPGWNNLGSALQALGDPEGAVRCYDEALRLQGGSELLYFFNRALALLAAGRLEEAIADIRRWASVSPFREGALRPVPAPDWIRFLKSIAAPRERQEAR